MTPAQRAVLAKAKKDGLKPSEQASEFLLHDLVEACLAQLRSYSVAWKNLSEKDQDASIKSLQDSLKESAIDAVRLIMSAGASAIPFKLKSLTIDGKLKVTGLVEGDHPERHALTDKAHDKSEILLILSPRDYFEGLEAIQGEKDQKSLPLAEDSDKPKPAKAAKATKAEKQQAEVILDEAIIDRGRSFVVEFKNTSISGLQAQLKIGYEKANAILKVLEGEGLVAWVGTEETGQYELVRAKSAPAEDKPVLDEATLEVFYATAVKSVLKAGSADDSVLMAIYGDDDNAIEVALMRMQDDGIVSEPSADGLRAVLTIPA